MYKYKTFDYNHQVCAFLNSEEDIHVVAITDNNRYYTLFYYKE